MELYRFAENCDYGAMKDKMICDRLVVGIIDDSLSKCLQLDANLMLEKKKKDGLRAGSSPRSGASTPSIQQQHAHCGRREASDDQVRAQPRASPSPSSYSSDIGSHKSTRSSAHDVAKVSIHKTNVQRRRLSVTVDSAKVISAHSASPNPWQNMSSDSYLETTFLNTVSST